MTSTWFITGTSTGFGRVLADYLATKDVNVVATARHLEQLDYLDAHDHGQILKLALDVTNREQINAAVQATIDQFGGIDVLVNNAGLGYFGTFEESDRDAARYMFDVNVWGLADMTRAVLPQMRQQKAGVIINFSSIAGLVGLPTLSFYNATKFAVEGLSESLAQEVADTGIKVMLIEPSGFRTDWAGRSSQKTLPTHDEYQRWVKRIEGNEEHAHHEAGDPLAAAEIIFDQVTNHGGTLPLHLPLGQWATDMAIDAYTKKLAVFKDLHDLSASADRPE